MWLRLGKSDQNSCILFIKLLIFHLFSQHLEYTQALPELWHLNTCAQSDLLLDWDWAPRQGLYKPCCLGLGSGPGVHRACLEPSLQRRLRLLLTCRCTFPAPAWHLSWGCRWLLPALSAAHPACAAAPCLITEGTACTWVTLGSQLSPLHIAAAWQLPSWATTYQS